MDPRVNTTPRPSPPGSRWVAAALGAAGLCISAGLWSLITPPAAVDPTPSAVAESVRAPQLPALARTATGSGPASEVDAPLRRALIAVKSVGDGLATLRCRVLPPVGPSSFGVRLVLRQRGQLVEERRVDASGQALFEVLLPGFYELCVDADSLPATLVTRHAGEALRLRADQVTTIPITLEATGCLEGVVLAPMGERLVRASIRAMPLDAPGPVQEIGCDTEGRFRWPLAPPGRYRLTLTASGSADRAEESCLVPVIVTVRSDASTWCDLRTRAARSCLAGATLTAKGDPVAGLRVLAQVEDAVTGGLCTLARTTSQMDGTFELGPLPEGPVWVAVDPRDARPGPMRRSGRLTACPEPVEVWVAPGSTRSLPAFVVQPHRPAMRW